MSEDRARIRIYDGADSVEIELPTGQRISLPGMRMIGAEWDRNNGLPEIEVTIGPSL